MTEEKTCDGHCHCDENKDNCETSCETVVDTDYKVLYEQAQQDLAKQKLMNQANLDNARKEHLQDLNKHIKYANEKIVTALIPLLDTFDIALQYDKSENSPILMLRKQFLQVLDKHNVTLIESEPGDEMDPNIHEAIEALPHDDFEHNQIIEVKQSGYKLHDRVIRPARVSVAKKD